MTDTLSTGAPVPANRDQPQHTASPNGRIRLPGIEQRALIKGRTLGDRYVRVELAPREATFRPRGQGTVEATERALQPHSRQGRAYAALKRIVLGRRLATSMEIFERLTKVKALAVLSSDAISSVAYATEASLGVLILAGVGALRLNMLIVGFITLLMVIVGTSYFQTIHAYPHGGGSYIVARDNMGDLPGLVAAAALLIDYVLTVSVSVSSGVDALASALPGLQPVSVELGVVFIALIMLVNLRGIRESGTIFAAPTYLFIGAFLVMIVTGIIHAALSPGGLLGAVPPATPPSQLGWGSTREHLGILLILTAFASGCVAMTGTEAISNGIPAFKPPEARNAGRTLLWMVGILATFYLGITYLAWRFGLEPYANQNPTLDAQIARLLFTNGFSWMFYVVQFATLLILVLAANTSFADFPRLSSILARDGFMPHLFAMRGDRLAFSTGIIALSTLSAALLVAFHGSTDALINLYALGVFTAYTLSQSGMVIRWRRLRERAGPGWRRSMVINLVGAITTAIVSGIIIVGKFDRGAWVVVVLVPILVLTFRGISKHYARVQTETETLTPLHSEDLRHIAIVPIAQLNLPAFQALAYARSVALDVIAVHVAVSEADEHALREGWARWIESRKDVWRRQGKSAPQLVVIESPYRSLVTPLVEYIDAVRDENPGATVSVALPEFVTVHWWERLLHNQTAFRLKLAFYSHPGVVVTNVPYHLKA